MLFSTFCDVNNSRTTVHLTSFIIWNFESCSAHHLIEEHFLQDKFKPKESKDRLLVMAGYAKQNGMVFRSVPLD